MAKDMNNLLTMHNKNDLTTHKAENVTSGNPHGIDAKANKAQEAWITPTLLNGWTNVLGQEVKYRKNQFGTVEIKGRVTGGIGVIFDLPSGYRPPEIRYYAVTSGAVFAGIFINQSGSVALLAGSQNTNVSLDACRFSI